MDRLEPYLRSKVELLGLSLYLGNVSKACRVMGVSRQHYYDIKKAYDKGGIEALASAWGPRLGRGRAGAATPAPPANQGRPEQTPEPGRPGGVLLAQTLHVGYFRGLGCVRQYTVIDAFSRLAFASVRALGGDHSLELFLEDEVLPVFRRHGLTVRLLVTCSDGGVMTEQELLAAEAFLAARGVGHTVLRCKDHKTALPCTRFNASCLRHYLKARAHIGRSWTIADLHAELTGLLDAHNRFRVRKGPPCNGRTPLATFTDALSPEFGPCEFLLPLAAPPA